MKQRAYGARGEDDARSARAALAAALSTLLRLFAPHLPFVTEEVWSWWQDGSVHRAAWPSGEELRATAPNGDPLVYSVAAEVLGEIRKAKTAAKQSMRAAVSRVVVRDHAERLDALRAALDDVREAGHVESFECEAAEAFAVEVELAS